MNRADLSVFFNTYDAKGTGATMTGDNTSRLHPSKFLDPQLLRCIFRNLLDLIFEVRRVDKVDMIFLERMLLEIFLHQLWDDLLQCAPVFLACDQLAVDNVNARVQPQNISYQSHSVADSSTCSEIIQISGDKAHSGSLGNGFGERSRFIQGSIGMLFQKVYNSQYHRCLSDGNMLGVYASYIVALFRCQQCILVRAGRNGRIRQMEDLLFRKTVMDFVKNTGKVVGGAGTGTWNFPGAVIIS